MNLQTSSYITKAVAMVDVRKIRSKIMLMTSVAGEMCMLFVNDKEQIHDLTSDQKNTVAIKILRMLNILVEIAIMISIDLHQSCERKIEMNAIKYPVYLCKVCSNQNDMVKRTQLTDNILHSTMNRAV